MQGILSQRLAAFDMSGTPQEPQFQFPNSGDCKALAAICVSNFKSSAHPLLLNPLPAMTLPRPHFPRMPCDQFEWSWFSLPSHSFFWHLGVSFPFLQTQSYTKTQASKLVLYLFFSFFFFLWSYILSSISRCSQQKVFWICVNTILLELEPHHMAIYIYHEQKSLVLFYQLWLTK